MEKELTKEELEEAKKLLSKEIVKEVKEKFWYLDWPGNPRFHQSDESRRGDCISRERKK